jgi:predicted molibdopterin-dependent oxidoreductase YjgC
MTYSEVNFTIDGLKVKARKGETILQAALRNGIYISHLCYHPDLKPSGSCRLCLVENKEGRIITSCENQPAEGMELSTTPSWTMLKSQWPGYWLPTTKPTVSPAPRIINASYRRYPPILE